MGKYCDRCGDKVEVHKLSSLLDLDNEGWGIPDLELCEVEVKKLLKWLRAKPMKPSPFLGKNIPPSPDIPRGKPKLPKKAPLRTTNLNGKVMTD